MPASTEARQHASDPARLDADHTPPLPVRVRRNWTTYWVAAVGFGVITVGVALLIAITLWVALFRRETITLLDDRIETRLGLRTRVTLLSSVSEVVTQNRRTVLVRVRGAVRGGVTLMFLDDAPAVADEILRRVRLLRAA